MELYIQVSTLWAADTHSYPGKPSSVCFITVLVIFLVAVIKHNTKATEGRMGLYLGFQFQGVNPIMRRKHDVMSLKPLVTLYGQTGSRE